MKRAVSGNGDRRQLDVFTVMLTVAVLLTALTLGGYVALIRQQGDEPRAWVVLLLSAALLLMLASARVPVAQRERTLMAASACLIIVGVLGIFSIGFPLLVAGGLALASTGREKIASRSDE